MRSGTRPGPRALPRRRKPSLAARIRPFWILAVLLAGALAWGGAWLVQAPWFRVARVGIDVPIGSPVSRDAVRAVAAIPAGANVWLLNPWAMTRRIEAMPYVDTATVRRGQFPQPFVEVAVTVRRPTACVRSSTALVTIDATARVLQRGCALAGVAQVDAGDAPLAAPGATLADPGVVRLLADTKTLGDAQIEVRNVRRDRWGGLEAVDVTGVTLQFGADADLTKKAALVGPVRTGVGAKRPIRAIDLRAPGTPIVRFRR